MKHVNENIKSIIALSIVYFSFGYFFAIAFLGFTADPQILIAVVAALSGVLGYYFGASSGSSKKDDTISDMAKNNTTHKEEEPEDINGGGIKNPKP